LAELAATNAANEEYVLDWARALHQAGRTAEAHATLGRLEALAVLNDELAGRLAAAYATCGAPDRARLFFQQAMRGDPLARRYSTWLACARVQTAEGDFDGARRTLRAAFANPANDEFPAIVAWLTAAGRAAQFAAELADFGLPPGRLTRVALALLEHFEKAGDFAQIAAVVEWRPAVLEAGVAARLRSAAETARSFEALAATWEKLLAQPDALAELPAELARLYGGWAEAELDASNVAPALTHLQRGHKLQPALFAIAFRLATVQAERSDRAGAIATLDSFLAASRDPAETAKARTFLDQLKSGTRQ
jgi:tetratricopeptide (TPR) repeat protein